MKLIAKLGATAVIAGSALALGAPAASANSFNNWILGGNYSYADGTDSFCVHAVSTNSTVSATLTAVSRSGPTRVVSDDSDYRGGSCTSLARAYEDTRYKAVVTSWVNGKRDIKTTYFWS